MNDKTQKTYHSNVRFSGSNETEIALFHPGTYTLQLELCNIGGKTYVKIYQR